MIVYNNSKFTIIIIIVNVSHQECIRESTQLHTVSMASTFRLNDITFCCTSTRC